MSRPGPPRITGLELKRPIGSGGFADVYLYEETVLRREVAVKVLAATPTAKEKASFDAEANVMAQLSSHPAIVPIYAVGVALDGRPYLTMEYCGGDPLSTRYRRAPLPVPEVLELGIQVGAAVETAHRAGILHRDIKPANVLTTAFGTPKLTDFGISHLLAAEGESVVGFSVPWSPPEVFGDDAPVDRRTDVYSLAATLHTLLAGRTPFEVTGGANDAAAMMSRIETARVPRLTRPDVPESLNRVLALGMAKQVTGRQPSAMALARALQEVQIEMRLPTTRIDVLDASTGPAQDGAGDDERTSVRPIQVIVPDVGTVVPPPRPGLVAMPAFSVEGTVGGPRRVPAPDVLEGTARPERRPTAEDDAEPAPAEEQDATHAAPAASGRSGLLVGALVGGLVAVVATAGVLSLLGGDDGDEGPTPRLDSGDVAPPVNDPVAVAAPRTPTRVTGTLDGPRTAVFTWRPRDPEDGDTYRWSLAGDGGETYYTLVDAPRAQVDVPAGRRACIVVTAVRGGQQSDPSPLACAESR